MAASVAGRSAFLCAISRATTRTASSTLRGTVSASPRPSGCPNFTLSRTRVSPPLSFRLMRRELSSLLPVHSAIASACLVSKLPSEVNSSTAKERSDSIYAWKEKAETEAFIETTCKAMVADVIKGWKLVRKCGNKVTSHKLVWFQPNVPKYGFTTWPGIHNRLRTLDGMNTCDIDGIYVLCRQQEESRMHLFFKGVLIKQIWEQVLQLFSRPRSASDCKDELTGVMCLCRNLLGLRHC